MRNIIIVFLLLIFQLNAAYCQKDSTKTITSSVSVFPALSSSPEIGFGFGAIGFLVLNDKSKKANKFYRPTSISPYIVYTTKNQLLTRFDVDIFLHNGININGNLRYLDFPDMFYGLGNQTKSDIVEQFTNQFVRINGRIMKPKNEHLFIGLLYDIQFNNILLESNTNSLFTQDIVGRAGGRNIGIGPSMLWDTRNSTLYPTTGKFLNIGLTTYSKLLGSEYSYTSFLLDYRKYFELFGPKNILAFQFRTQLNTDSDIPFYKLNQLGGGIRLRGIEHKNLYMSKQSAFLQVEARQELFWRFGGVLFAGLGEVFDSFSSFNTENIRYVYGLGGRFQALKDEKLNIRMDLGFTDNGQRAFYLSVREAF